MVAEDGQKLVEKGEILYELAVAHLRQEHFKEAQEYCEEALQIFTEAQTEQHLPKVYYRLGISIAAAGDVNAALPYLETAQQLATEQEDWYVLAMSFASRGDIDSMDQNFNEAVGNYQQAIVYYEKSEKTEQVAKMYLLISEILLKHDKLEQGIKGLEMAVKMFEELKDYDEAGWCYRKAASVLERYSNTERAAHFFQKAAECFARTPNVFQQADSYHHAGYVCEEGKEYEKALEYYELALQYAREAENQEEQNTETDSEEMPEEEEDVLTETILDAMEHTREKLAKKQSKSANGGGFFGKIKGLFGS